MVSRYLSLSSTLTWPWPLLSGCSSHFPLQHPPCLPSALSISCPGLCLALLCSQCPLPLPSALCSLFITTNLDAHISSPWCSISGAYLLSMVTASIACLSAEMLLTLPDKIDDFLLHVPQHFIHAHYVALILLQLTLCASSFPSDYAVSGCY